MNGKDKEPPKTEEPKVESAAPAPTTPLVKATENVNYNIFQDARIEVNDETKRTKVSVHRPGNIIQSLEADTSFIAACAMDNTAGSLLASAAAVNAQIKQLLDKK